MTDFDQFHAHPRGAYAGRGVSDGHSMLLTSKLHGLQRQHQGHMPPSAGQSFALPNETYMNSFSPQPYGTNAQNPFGLGAVAQYLPAIGMWSESLLQPPMSLPLLPPPPRGPARALESGHPRSPLLEDFRANAKTNRRYELRDILDHVVEFSGDQHGSRFIQQKLETANGEEKERIFAEILPNSVQLMKDVFGNYIIQKFFEHGTQHQKTILADRMKGQMLVLSLQTYGCRVVQKALEHVLVDQQASLIREIGSHVLQCVKDQNGNHVVQKAIERIPLQHIQFIIDAFTGQVHVLATHPYGCRVIQRMLEHCGEGAQRRILDELFAAGTALVLNEYGNYVSQHVIEHGREHDRERLIKMVTAQLLHFSKHKYASNVVEKTIEFGTDAQRKEFLAVFTTVPLGGVSPLQSLIRDQFGNYVVQKLLARLNGADHDRLVDEIQPQLGLLKRCSYGKPYSKQITAIEKLVQRPSGYPSSSATPPASATDTVASQSLPPPPTIPEPDRHRTGRPLDSTTLAPSEHTRTGPSILET